MPDKFDKNRSLDDFWDISSLVSSISSSRKPLRSLSKSVSTVEIRDGDAVSSNDNNRLTESSTVIERFIPPHSATVTNNDFSDVCSYEPPSVLLHKVSLYKLKSSYDFYSDFCADALRLWDASAEECEYAEFFSYSPQYDQLTPKQLSYYLWWRENARQGSYIKTNSCYINLYFFELINVRDKLSPFDARELMIEIIKNYPNELKGAVSRYIKWICDFSLIHRLSPPKNHSAFLMKNAATLKEYFVRVSHDSPLGWANTLLEYCCSYDYKTSKFARGDALALFDTHVVRALARAVEFLSSGGRILSDLPFGDCKITLKAFEGAICAPENRYAIEAEYCSFSRSHELRFLVGDIVKYCENKIRAHIFVKSRLTVYSIPTELREVIDKYFEEALPAVKRSYAKKEAPQEYEVLYDLPKKQLDLSNAAKIESESWETTRELVEAFDDVQELVEDSNNHTKEELSIELPVENDNTEGIMEALGEYAECVRVMARGDNSLLFALSRSKAIPTDVIVDAINEIAVNVIGDILIDGDGSELFILDDYKDMIE